MLLVLALIFQRATRFGMVRQNDRQHDYSMPSGSAPQHNNQLGMTAIYQHASEIAVDFAVAFWRNFSGPAALSIVQNRLSDIIDSTIITILSYYHEHDCFFSTIAIIIHSTRMCSYLYKVHASINCSCLVVYNTTTSVGNGY